MIGFDRPLRPYWIYEILRKMNPGDSTHDYNDIFAAIAEELIGKEGKRKVRTVVFRSYIYSLQDTKIVIENNHFIQWVNKHSLKTMQPLFLMKLILDYEVLFESLKKMFLLIQSDGAFSPNLLKKQIVQKYGDRDIVKRSVNAFLTTMVHFKMLYQENGKNLFYFTEKQQFSDEQTRMFLLLYADFYLKSRMVDIDSIDANFLKLFLLQDLIRVAKKYNGLEWEYIRDNGRNVLLLHLLKL